MSLRYVLVVTEPAYGSQLARTAYQFACAAIEAGHQISKVFFYQDGVLNGTATTVPANDEFDIVAAWQSLAREHQVQLELALPLRCVVALSANKRRRNTACSRARWPLIFRKLG